MKGDEFAKILLIKSTICRKVTQLLYLGQKEKNMKVPKLVVLFGCVCLMGVRIEANAMTSQTEANEYADKELMVLIDTSGSIKGEMKEMEIQWAQNICAFCDAIGVNSTYVYFDDPEEIYAPALLTSDGVETCLNILANMPHNGLLTELAGPMEYAVSFMEGKTAKNKYIIMLSDGDEDIVGRNGQSLEEIPYSNDEKDNIARFKKLVFDFDNKENQKVILVGLGTDISLFSELSVEHGLSYFSGNEGPEDSIIYLLKEMGYPVDEVKGSEWNGVQTVTLKENLYRAIFNIRWDSNVKYAEDMWHITYMSKEIENFLTIPASDTSLFIYIPQPEPGQYEIYLSSDNMTCTVFQQEIAVLNGIELSIIGENRKELEYEIIEGKDTEIKKYTIDEGIYEFLIEPKMTKGNMENWYHTVAYCIKSYNPEEETTDDIQFRTEEWIKKKYGEESWEIPDLEPGNYACIVKTVTNGQPDISNIILIEVKENSICEPDQQHEIKNVGDEINLGAYISQTETDRCYFSVQIGEDGKIDKFRLKDNISNEFFKVIEEKLIFMEEGKYTMKINEKNFEKSIILFEIRKEKSFWEKLCEKLWFCGKQKEDSLSVKE